MKKKFSLKRKYNSFIDFKIKFLKNLKYKYILNENNFSDFKKKKYILTNKNVNQLQERKLNDFLKSKINKNVQIFYCVNDKNQIFYVENYKVKNTKNTKIFVYLDFSQLRNVLKMVILVKFINTHKILINSYEMFSIEKSLDIISYILKNLIQFLNKNETFSTQKIIFIDNFFETNDIFYKKIMNYQNDKVNNIYNLKFKFFARVDNFYKKDVANNSCFYFSEKFLSHFFIKNNIEINILKVIPLHYLWFLYKKNEKNKKIIY